MTLGLGFTHLAYSLSAFSHPNGLDKPKLPYSSVTHRRECSDKWIQINRKDQHNRTIIDEVIVGGTLDDLDMLIRNGADINHVDRDWRSPLMITVLHNKKELFKHLITHGADQLIPDRRGYTVLHTAAVYENLEIVKELLPNKYLRMAKAHDGTMAILQMILNDNDEGVKLFLEYEDQKKNDDLLKLFKVAALKNKTKSLKVLIEAMDPKSLRDYVGNEQFILNSIVNDADQTLEYLLCEGLITESQLKDTTSQSDSLLHIAARNNKFKIIRFLQRIGFDLELVNELGETPLLKAVIHQSWDAATTLIEMGANIMARDNEGYDVLVYAFDNEDIQGVEILLDKGSDIHFKDISGTSLLHIVAMNGYKNGLRFLLKHNIDLHARDNYGNNALHYAVMNKDNMEMLIELLNLNISIYDKDFQKKTPLKLAEYNRFTQSVGVLSGQTLFNNDLIKYSKSGNLKKAKELRVNGMEIRAQLSAQDKDGKYPLEIALNNEYKDLAIWLFREGAVLGNSNPYRLLKYFLFEGDLKLLRTFCSKYPSFIKTIDDVKVRAFINKLKITSKNKQKLAGVLETFGMKRETLWYESRVFHASAVIAAIPGVAFLGLKFNK